MLKLKGINYKLYLSMLVFAFLPTIYSTLRIFYLGNIPNEWTFSIAGQLSWVSLLYEILTEAIILPLFFFIGKNIEKKDKILNLVKTGLVISFIPFFIVSSIIIAFPRQLLELMAINPNIIEETIPYIRLEAVANIFLILLLFVQTIIFSIKKEKYIYLLTFLRLILTIFLDTVFISNFNFSLKLGVNGIGYSNILLNLSLFILSLFILAKEDINIFKKIKLDFSWVKELAKIGGVSGLESFVRNIFYLIMISRMVNVVNEQGTYWVANSFIWGWLLLPILQLGELSKLEVSQDKDKFYNNISSYFTLTVIICSLWFITIPFWKGFMLHILNFKEVDKLFDLALLLSGFYIFFALQNVVDSIFYGIGKIQYILWQSLIVNIIYYGIAFILYLKGYFTPSLKGIALLFGYGLIFDFIVSFISYYILRKKEK
ncbi:MATE family Na+-driven efflux transporter [uncultured Fusobacterium sp.]|uniref:MATE family Na+-driven efflux transporter n=1 Tax=uncultured Fusobacterium sp. TaxID=159267 RepID=UPI0015A66D96|nr:MATE family Na+-driven efflux transporter [uncultured Fusobacterium sp.]